MAPCGVHTAGTCSVASTLDEEVPQPIRRPYPWLQFIHATSYMSAVEVHLESMEPGFLVPGAMQG